ncbi:hypothetical protein BH10PSE19_BH10PSE19_16230 [soil metagenome]
MNSSFDRQFDSVEELILAAKQKLISPEKLLPKLLTTNFYTVYDERILTKKEIILPLCVGIDGQNHVCVFTKKDWANSYIAKNIAIIKLEARKLLEIIPTGYGLIINPNHDASIKFAAFGIQNILRDFS